MISATAENPLIISISDEQSEVQLVCEQNVRGLATIDFAKDLPSDFTASIDVTVETGGDLTLLVLQNADAEKISISQKSTIKEGGALHVHNITLGGSSVEHAVENHLKERGAISNVHWAFFARGTEKYAVTARNVFHAADGGGEMLLKGVAEENAYVSCDGMIDIQAGGRGTDTYLTEDVLMLDSTAKVDAIPGLEIKTNDVKASHSATVSQVTPLDLFYFAARGIDETQARRMYVEGFLEDVVQDLPENLKEEIAENIEAKYIG